MNMKWRTSHSKVTKVDHKILDTQLLKEIDVLYNYTTF